MDGSMPSFSMGCERLGVFHVSPTTGKAGELYLHRERRRKR